MSVRVVARIRPLLKAEVEKDVIVDAAGEGGDGKTVVKIPNPKNEAEAFSFQFNSVYDRGATQAQIFDNEGEHEWYIALAGIELTKRSLAYSQASFQRLRCHPLRIWRHRNRQDTHNARRQVASRSRSHPTSSLRHIPKSSED
jgi:hypothetical protein